MVKRASKNLKPNEKIFVLLYYSGHGATARGSNRACLSDNIFYPWEVKIRNFAITNPQTYVLAITDACRKNYKSKPT